MPMICYVEKRFNEVALEMIDKVNDLVDRYQAQGFDLTLRQIYYQFVAADLFPADRKFRMTDAGKWVRDPEGTINAEPNYKWLGDIISEGRRAGLIDWEAIVDRTRHIRNPIAWDSPAALVAACADQYDVDRWKNQPFHVEVWVEKDALVGVIEQACEPWKCPYFSCRGYTSDSEIWSSAQRMKEIHDDQDKRIVILHLGDHDPSGVDMSRDIQDRLCMFSGLDEEQLDVRRIALTMDQVKKVNPPPNPAKITDSRAKEYIRIHGKKSWELDALDPTFIAKLIEREMKKLINKSEWAAAEQRRDDGRETLNDVAARLEDEEAEI